VVNPVVDIANEICRYIPTTDAVKPQAPAAVRRLVPNSIDPSASLKYPIPKSMKVIATKKRMTTKTTFVLKAAAVKMKVYTAQVMR